MDQGGRFDPLGPAFEVGFDFFLRAPLARGPNDESAGERTLVFEDEVPQLQAFLLGGDFARNTDVLNRGQVHEVTTGQSDVRGDARALGAQRFLRDLHQDFLAFLEQLGNLGSLAVAGPSAVRTTSRALRPGARASGTSAAAPWSVAGTLVRLAQSVASLVRLQSLPTR